MKISVKKPLYGLILAGGHSTRMGTDKSTLKYHGQSQCGYCFELLSSYCEKVFISNRKEQSNLPEHKMFPQIHDIFRDIGPMGGILSAMTAYPKVAWLVLACDLPYVTKEIVATLIKNRDQTQMATAFFNTSDGLLEPLCAIYEPISRYELIHLFRLGRFSLREALHRLQVKFIKPKNQYFLTNVNEPPECTEALKMLSKRG